jgi:hypothetical protein
MTKRLSDVDENSAANTVAARLALYVTLAGAAGASAALALRHHNRKAAMAEAAETSDTPTGLVGAGFRMSDESTHGASVKNNLLNAGKFDTPHAQPASTASDGRAEPPADTQEEPGRAGMV